MWSKHSPPAKKLNITDILLPLPMFQPVGLNHAMTADERTGVLGESIKWAIPS